MNFKTIYYLIDFNLTNRDLHRYGYFIFVKNNFKIEFLDISSINYRDLKYKKNFKTVTTHCINELNELKKILKSKNKKELIVFDLSDHSKKIHNILDYIYLNFCNETAYGGYSYNYQSKIVRLYFNLIDSKSKFNYIKNLFLRSSDIQNFSI